MTNTHNHITHRRRPVLWLAGAALVLGALGLGGCICYPVGHGYYHDGGYGGGYGGGGHHHRGC